MNLAEILNVIGSLEGESRMRWLIDLGWAMTVSARAGYPHAQQADPIPHLIAFNELQHQLFNFLRNSEREDEWPIEEFVKALSQKAEVSGVEGDFGWALKSSVESLSSRQ